jgi:hypothetical protein
MARKATTSSATAPVYSDGDWSFDPVTLVIRDDMPKRSNPVATVQRREPTNGFDETSANGWIMAAAPELLEACKTAFGLLYELKEKRLSDDALESYTRGTEAMLLRAWDKAEGRG